jgi:hypothetical protein
MESLPGDREGAASVTIDQATRCLALETHVQAADQQVLATDSGVPEPGGPQPQDSGDFYHTGYLSSI